MDKERVYLKTLAKIFDASYQDYEYILDSVIDCPSESLFLDLFINNGEKEGIQKPSLNRIIQGDNILLMKELLRNSSSEKIDLIYIDPPFFSKNDYDAVVKLTSKKLGNFRQIKINAYEDYRDEVFEEYLKMLLTRCLLMRDLLADTGSFWIHLDWHVVHYVKVFLDEVFGKENFVNEIIWQYKSGGSSSRRFSRKHDTLLFYSKGPKYYFKPQKQKSYNRKYLPYRFKGVKEYRDEKGWYTLVNQKDVWSIDMVGRTSKERTGYASQKPEALISLIMESCTKPGDLCVDFFAGSGTLANVAHKAGRRYYSCDIGKVAIAHSVSRMAMDESSFILQQEKDLYTSSLGNTMIPEVFFHVDLLEKSTTSKQVLKIKLNDYKVDTTYLFSSKKDKELLNTFIKEDPIGMIAYWSVDSHYDGKVHHNRRLMTKQSGDIQIVFEELGESFEHISIVGADILGNIFKKEYKLS